MTSKLKLAIIGGGPSAFYVASRLLQLLPASSSLGENLRMHLYDRLWAPHGLVRYGVAPDHPEVKNCTHKFDEAGNDKRVSFFGNVNVSSRHSPISHAINVSPTTLFPHYTHLLFASGSTIPRVHPSLPPSDLCRPALDLVHWYTAHPNKPLPPPLTSAEHVTVIGMGNVALDVARMLLAPDDHLKKYDVPQHILGALRSSRVKHVNVVGRRGPKEVAFTAKELREMLNLPNTSLEQLKTEAYDATEPGEKKLTRQQTRILQLIRGGSKASPGSTPHSWSLDFFRSPIGLERLPNGSSHALRLSLANMAVDEETGKAKPTGSTCTLDTDLVLYSLGYQSELDGLPWMNSSLGTVRNVGGRIIGADGRVCRNVYASGWAANGARGVLASTMLNAHALVDTILSDLRYQNQSSASKGESQPLETAGIPVVPSPADALGDGVEGAGSTMGTEEVLARSDDVDLDGIPPEVVKAVRSGLVMRYGDWKKVDAEEVRRGLTLGKERERMDWEEARKFISPMP